MYILNVQVCLCVCVSPIIHSHTHTHTHIHTPDAISNCNIYQHEVRALPLYETLRYTSRTVYDLYISIRRIHNTGTCTLTYCMSGKSPMYSEKSPVYIEMSLIHCKTHTVCECACAWIYTSVS